MKTSLEPDKLEIFMKRTAVVVCHTRDTNGLKTVSMIFILLALISFILSL